MHSAWLHTVGFGPPVQGKSAFPSTPISVGQRAIVPVTEGGGRTSTVNFGLLRKHDTAILLANVI